MNRKTVMVISSFQLDIGALLKPDVLVALESLPDGGLSFFCSLLQGSSLDVPPLADLGTTALAGDDTKIVRFVWNDELVTTALRTTQLHFNLIAHESPRR
jgi:hypothetical protein